MGLFKRSYCAGCGKPVGGPTKFVKKNGKLLYYLCISHSVRGFDQNRISAADMRGKAVQELFTGREIQAFHHPAGFSCILVLPEHRCSSFGSLIHGRTKRPGTQ